MNWLLAIPVYNNAGTIGDVVTRARSVAPRVLVVDDGSTDGSGSAAQAAGATIVTHEKNRGKGAALKTALAFARENGFSHLLVS